MEIDIELIKNSIVDAIRNHELSSVKRLFDLSGNLFEDYAFKDEILKSSCRYGDVELIQYIFEKDSELKNHFIDHKLIFFVIDYNNVPIIEYLINNDLDKYFLSEDSIDYEYYPDILHYACEKGYLDVIKLLVNLKIDINSKDCYGRTCFYKAFIWNKIETADLLYKLGADIFIETDTGELPLFSCETHRNIEYLIENGYYINQKNEYDQNSVFFTKGDLLLWCGNKNLNYFQIDKNGNNALHWACFNSDAGKVKQLLHLKLDPNFKDNNNWTALHFACIQGNVQIIIALLREGADVNANTNLNQTPLHMACLANHSIAVEALLAYDALQSSKDVFDKLPIEYVNSSTIETLLGSLGCSIEPRIVLYDEVQEAIINRDSAKIENLIEEKFNFDSKSYEENHPLFLSTYYADFNVFKLLLPQYSFANRYNEDQEIEVDFASYCPFYYIEDLFDTKGRDLLQYAIIKKNKDVVDFLIENNFNLIHQDKKGNTALHYAVLNEDYQLIRRLILKGSDINLENYNREAPSEFAINKGNLYLIRFLKSDAFKMLSHFNLSKDNDEEDEEDWDENDFQVDFHYYDNPAQNPHENPWINVFGEGEEAEDAYWNTE